MNQPHNSSTPQVRRERLVQGAKFDFERLTMRTPDGKELVRHSVCHPGAVVVLPILESGGTKQVVLIRNWRISVEQWLYELPAGTLEAGEDPGACAGRELEEETGYAAASITPLCHFYTSPGLSNELMWAYAATGLREVGQSLEPDEWVTVHPTPLDEAFTMIDAGILTDGKSILTLLLARQRGLL